MQENGCAVVKKGRIKQNCLGTALVKQSSNSVQKASEKCQAWLEAKMAHC